MLKNYKELKVWQKSYAYGSVCELETQTLLAGDLDLIEEYVLSAVINDIKNIEIGIETHPKLLIRRCVQNPTNLLEHLIHWYGLEAPCMQAGRFAMVVGGKAGAAA